MPRISRKREQNTANCGLLPSADEVKLVCFPGISRSFEAFDRTTENRGVPGSSPGLAIERMARPPTLAAGQERIQVIS